MSFPREVLLAGINIADALTAGVQMPISHYAWSSADGDGDESYGSAATIYGVVDQTRKQVSTPQGRVVAIVATLTFPRGGILIGPKDKMVLPDGTTGPLILDAPDAVFDPVTGRGFITTVRIGEVGRQTGP
jgi:hypothetical protein